MTTLFKQGAHPSDSAEKLRFAQSAFEFPFFATPATLKPYGTRTNHLSE
jgi:hypothetical protein